MSKTPSSKSKLERDVRILKSELNSSNPSLERAQKLMNTPQSELRVCYKCRIEKPLTRDYFYPCRERFSFLCKVCHLEYHREYRIKNRERDAQREKERLKLPAAKARKIAYTYKMMAKYPERWKARSDLRNAVATGKVVKMPCEVCGGLKVQGHHEDYSKPLEVRWLCSKHHKQLHYERGDFSKPYQKEVQHG